MNGQIELIKRRRTCQKM